ncbi:hypothetical protein ACFLWJ_00965 [Chloroflexota bacterium]
MQQYGKSQKADGSEESEQTSSIRIIDSGKRYAQEEPHKSAKQYSVDPNAFAKFAGG